jgi:hypothetical protein
MGGAATTAVTADHLHKVIRRTVYYRSESSYQVPTNPDLCTMSEVNPSISPNHTHTQESNQLPDPEYDSRLPQHELDFEFYAIEKYQKLTCVHGHTPARRICTEGFNIGRRFLSCPLEVISARSIL